MARRLGLDPNAVDAVGSQEGFSGRIGDGGHAFGPFQENNAGGVLTGRFPGASAQQLNNWAWSKPGIMDALTRMASVARGETGSRAVQDIVSRFERPANPGAEIAGALRSYGGPLRASGPTGPVGAIQSITGGSGGGGLDQQLVGEWLLQQAQNTLTGGDQGGGLLGLALARRALESAAPQGGGTPALPLVPGSKSGPMKASGTAGGFLPRGAAYTPGRLDQGHDFQTNPGAPIIAPGDGVVVAVKSDPNGFGPAYPIVHFTSGPYAGKDIYIGHTISQLRPGSKFSAGSVISLTGKNPIGNAQVPGWAEIGFAANGLPGPDGQSTPF